MQTVQNCSPQKPNCAASRARTGLGRPAALASETASTMAPAGNGNGSKPRRAKQKQQSQGSPSSMPSEAVIDAQLSLAFDIMAATRACAAARAAAELRHLGGHWRAGRRDADAAAGRGAIRCGPAEDGAAPHARRHAATRMKEMRRMIELTVSI